MEHTPLLPNIDTQESFGAIVQGLTATYDKASDRILLSWEEPDDLEDISFYRIYRSTNSVYVLKNGQDVLLPDTSAEHFISEEPRNHVPRDRTSFTDRLGLPQDIYWYGIRPVRIVGADTTEGQLSNIDSVQVSTGVLFSINDGAVHTATDRVELTVIDIERSIKSIEFTQKYTPMLVREDQRLEFRYDDPLNPPSIEKIKDAIDRGLLSSGGMLAGGVDRVKVPDFDAVDPENPSRGPFSTGGKARFTTEWILEKGNGDKTVWARIVYNDGTSEVKKDDIGIQPWGNNNYIRLRLRNETTGLNRTMWQSELGEYYLYRPWINFSVSIFADTTIEEDFHYWLAFPHKHGVFLYDQVLPGSREWLETKAIPGRLTDAGPAHDDAHEYTFMLSPDLLEERGQLGLLNELRNTYNKPNENLGFALRGSEKLNETAVPGSYWGQSPKRYSFSTGNYEEVQRIMTGDPRRLLDSLLHLGRNTHEGGNSRYQTGRKEFYIFAVFRGKYFKDTRVAVLFGETLDLGFNSTRAYIDMTPPAVEYPGKTTEMQFFNNDATLGKTFSLELTNAIDKGYANIERIELVIAKKPDEFPWDKTITPLNMTPEELLTFNNSGRFPFEVIVPDVEIYDLSWDDIDASNWSSGDYIMGIVTEDEYGNSGFAPMESDQDLMYTNPWRVTIQTGR